MASTSTNHPTVAVCLKWVATSPEIDPLTGEIATDRRFSGFSAADLAALEWAMRIADVNGTPVTAISVGGGVVDEGLRLAMAYGADEVIRIDPGPGERSSRAVAAMLATACRSASLVLCGDYSLDRGSGSVPAFLADELGIGQALGCVSLDLDGPEGADPGREMAFVAERRLDQGRRERLLLKRPAVLSFEGGIEPRRAPLAATLAAATAPVPVVTGTSAVTDGSAVTVVATGPYRPRAMVSTAPTGSTLDRIRQLTGAGQERPAAQQLELDPAEAAEVVYEQLERWGYIGPADEQPDPGQEADGRPR